VYGVLALVCATGLCITFVSSVRADAPRSLATRIIRFFSYFTIESNILVCAVALLLAVGVAHGRRFALAHLDALLGITVTGIVFALVLAPDQEHVGFSSVLLHYVAPPLALLAWLVLGPWSGALVADHRAGARVAARLPAVDGGPRRDQRLVPVPLHRRGRAGVRAHAAQRGARPARRPGARRRVHRLGSPAGARVACRACQSFP
jgi:hypothetical protein